MEDVLELPLFPRWCSAPRGGAPPTREVRSDAAVRSSPRAARSGSRGSSPTSGASGPTRDTDTGERPPLRDRRSASPEFELLELDAVSWLRSLASESVDLVITDPPYESLEKHRAIGTTTRLKHSKASSNNWFKVFPNARFPELFTELHRVLRRDRHLYLFCDQETMFVAKPAAESAGFRFWKPLVWDKQTIGMGYHYRSRYEFILFFEKGKRRLKDLGVPDVISEPRIRGGYPAEKPVAISELLVRQSSEPGMLVIDPFTGSGSAGVAAVTLGRSFLGTDLAREAIDLASGRLERASGRRAPELYARVKRS